MTQRIGLHDAPAAGFDEPFAMLEACHERVQRSLALLQRLAAHVRTTGADAQAAAAASDVLRYFELAAPQHHEDEERHVFPRLLAAGEPALADAVAQLKRDHLRMAELWVPVRTLLQAWSRGEPAPLDTVAKDAIDAFTAIYDGHIRCEETLVFPAARSRCDAVALAAMGDEMRARRQGPAAR